MAHFQRLAVYRIYQRASQQLLMFQPFVHRLVAPSVMVLSSSLGLLSLESYYFSSLRLCLHTSPRFTFVVTTSDNSECTVSSTGTVRCRNNIVILPEFRKQVFCLFVPQESSMNYFPILREIKAKKSNKIFDRPMKMATKFIKFFNRPIKTSGHLSCEY